MADNSEDSTPSDESPSVVDHVKRVCGPNHLVGQSLRDILVTLIALSIIAGVLLMYTGLWPPFVSIISGSMEPDLERGDLVLVVDTDRNSVPAEFKDRGIVTYEAGEQHGYTSFGEYGDVIVFSPNNGANHEEIIHRAMFYVEDGEDWSDRADSEYTKHNTCDRMSNCPAPHSGFITLGDANSVYDQSAGISGPVPLADVRGVAVVDIPYAGYFRLYLSGE